MKLTISDLSKTYPNGVQALKNVALEIPTGMFGLLGPNGAGKSTLMRTIATLQDADTGSIQLDEVNVLEQKNDIRKLLGYLPQCDKETFQKAQTYFENAYKYAEESWKRKTISDTKVVFTSFL